MLTVLALVLVTLPALASSQENQWQEVYKPIEDHTPDYGYVCCNQPPTHHRRWNLRSLTSSMSKRGGDKYEALQRFYDDFGGQDQQQQQQQQQQPASDQEVAAVAEELSRLLASRHGARLPQNQDPLLHRLLSSAKARAVLQRLTDGPVDSQAPRSLLRLLDYPSKRGSFVPDRMIRANGSPGGTNLYVSFGKSSVKRVSAGGPNMNIKDMLRRQQGKK